MDENNVKLMHKSESKHADFCYKQNSAEGLNIRRHLENMVATYGARYTTSVVLGVLAEEIKAIKQSKKAQKAG